MRRPGYVGLRLQRFGYERVSRYMETLDDFMPPADPERPSAKPRVQPKAARQSTEARHTVQRSGSGQPHPSQPAAQPAGYEQPQHRNTTRQPQMAADAATSAASPQNPKDAAPSERPSVSRQERSSGQINRQAAPQAGDTPIQHPPPSRSQESAAQNRPVAENRGGNQASAQSSQNIQRQQAQPAVPDARSKPPQEIPADLIDLFERHQNRQQNKTPQARPANTPPPQSPTGSTVQRRPADPAPPANSSSPAPSASTNYRPMRPDQRTPFTSGAEAQPPMHSSAADHISHVPQQPPPANQVSRRHEPSAPPEPISRRASAPSSNQDAPTKARWSASRAGQTPPSASGHISGSTDPDAPQPEYADGGYDAYDDPAADYSTPHSDDAGAAAESHDYTPSPGLSPSAPGSHDRISRHRAAPRPSERHQPGQIMRRPEDSVTPENIDYSADQTAWPGPAHAESAARVPDYETHGVDEYVSVDGLHADEAAAPQSPNQGSGSENASGLNTLWRSMVTRHLTSIQRKEDDPAFDLPLFDEEADIPTERMDYEQFKTAFTERDLSGTEQSPAGTEPHAQSRPALHPSRSTAAPTDHGPGWEDVEVDSYGEHGGYSGNGGLRGGGLSRDHLSGESGIQRHPAGYSADFDDAAPDDVSPAYLPQHTTEWQDDAVADDPGDFQPPYRATGTANPNAIISRSASGQPPGDAPRSAGAARSRQGTQHSDSAQSHETALNRHPQNAPAAHDSTVIQRPPTPAEADLLQLLRLPRDTTILDQHRENAPQLNERPLDEALGIQRQAEDVSPNGPTPLPPQVVDEAEETQDNIDIDKLSREVFRRLRARLRNERDRK